MICTAQFRKQTAILWSIVALLLIPAFSEARVISVQLSAPTFAFGGYSWPGVGQYEKITGVAYGEVDPADWRNAIIVDIGLAEPQAAPGQPGKTPNGKVAYLLNFYILKPINLNQVDRKLIGYGKMMYEPPNRGGKTWTALGRVNGGGDDPATITDPAILANSFIMPRGYTVVWSGWDPLVPLANLAHRAERVGLRCRLRKTRTAQPDHGSGIRIHRDLGERHSTISYPAADTADKTTAVLTHRVHLDDVPQVSSREQIGITTRPERPLRLTGTAFIANDIYEFSYTAKDPVRGRSRLCGRFAIGFPGCATRRRTTTVGPTRWPTTSPGSIPKSSSQPGRMLNDFRKLGFNEDDRGRIGRKVFDGHMQWIAAGSGIGMNYRFSQSGRTERNRQNHLYAENLFPFANVRTTDPFTGITASRYDACQADKHVRVGS